MIHSSYDSAPPHHADPRPRRPPSSGQHLADRLREGEEFAVTFGGQGTDWFATLTELVRRGPRHLPARPPGRGVRPPDRPGRRPARRRAAAPLRAAGLARPRGGAARAPTSSAPRSACPGVLLTQLATLDLLAAEGLDLTRDRARRRRRPQPGHPRRRRLRRPPRGRAATAASDVDLMAIARLIGAAATIVGRRAGLVPHGEDSPMLAVSGADPRRGRGARRRGLRRPGRRRRRPPSTAPAASS